MAHKIKLKIGETTNDCSIEIDGIPLKVVRMSFDIVAGQATIVKLEIYSEVEVEGDVFIATAKYTNKVL